MNKKFYKQNKEIENKYKQKCVICGETAKCCLQFHHIRDKKYNISQSVSYLSPELFKQELDKCICVCMNCHAKLHDNKIRLPADLDA